MYRYSKNVHAKFLRQPELCYLLIFFSVHPAARELTERKLEGKAVAYRQRIILDISKLAKEALIALHDSDNAEKSQVYIHLAKQLQQQYRQQLSGADAKNLSLNLSSLSAGGGSFNRNLPAAASALQRSGDSSLMLDSYRSGGQQMGNSDTDEQMFESSLKAARPGETPEEPPRQRQKPLNSCTLQNKFTTMQPPKKSDNKRSVLERDGETNCASGAQVPRLESRG